MNKLKGGEVGMNNKDIINSLNDSLDNLHVAFIDGIGDVYAVSEEIIKNILALLKEQEPGVMALEEVKKHNNKDNCVWFELRDIVVIPVFVRHDRQETIIENQCILSDQTIPHLYWKNIDYCKKWRCWNAKPTDEQRKMVKWE